MYSDGKKIQLIEEVLKLNNDAVFKELETVLRKSRAKKVKVTPKQKFLSELRDSTKEVALARKGKIKLQSAKSFLNEL